jgi:hypothetical protein
MLSEAAQRRLVMYCRRAAVAPTEWVHRDVCGGRTVPYSDPALRALVWNDVEVRTALRSDDCTPGGVLGGVLRRHRCPHGLSLLQLRSDVDLEAERAGVAA